MHGDVICGLIRMGLASIQGAFTARKLTLDADGDVVDLGRDFEVGFAAMNLITNLFIRGREMCPAPPEMKRTAAELLALVAKSVRAFFEQKRLNDE